MHRVVNICIVTGLICLAWFLARSKTGLIAENRTIEKVDAVTGLLLLASGFIAIITLFFMIRKEGAGAIRWWQWVYLVASTAYLARFLWSFVLIVFGGY